MRQTFNQQSSASSSPQNLQELGLGCEEVMLVVEVRNGTTGTVSSSKTLRDFRIATISLLISHPLVHVTSPISPLQFTRKMCCFSFFRVTCHCGNYNQGRARARVLVCPYRDIRSTIIEHHAPNRKRETLSQNSILKFSEIKGNLRSFYRQFMVPYHE